jgi:hypothetical protein
MTTYTFITPFIKEGPAGTGPLFERYSLNKGVSVYRNNGVYKEARYLDEDTIRQYDIFYRGGYNYVVDEDEANRLIAAGYNVVAS